MNEYDYPDGIDCVWVAVDRDGNVGAFITAGIGPIPVQAMSAVQEKLELMISELPTISETSVRISGLQTDSYVAMAKKGFYVFDWLDIHRTNSESSGLYEIVAVPNLPLRINDLVGVMGGLVQQTRFENVSFSEVDHVDVRAIVECREVDG